MFTDGGEPERIRLGRLTPTVFTVLDARAFIGRVFDVKDAASRQADTVILSHGFWLRRFGGAPDVIGRSVRVDDLAYTVIGVMPAGFAFPDRETQAWIRPTSRRSTATTAPHFAADLRRPCADAIRGHAGAGRRRGHRPGSGRADPGTAALALFGSGEPPRSPLRPALDAVIAEVRPAIRILLAGVLLLFCTAVASVATVQLARGQDAAAR